MKWFISLWIFFILIVIIDAKSFKEGAFSQNDKLLVWFSPTDTICKKNGGKIDKKKICDASWDDARRICKKSNARLPTLSEFKGLVSSCFGKNIWLSSDRWDKVSVENKENKNYKKCYQKKGFSNDYYWTYNGSNYWWAMTLHLEIGYGKEAKYSELYVKCVR